MSLFEYHIASCLPDPLRERGEFLSTRLFDALSEQQQAELAVLFKKTPVLAKQFARAMVGSEYVFESCCRNPDLLFEWLLADMAFNPLTTEKIVEMISGVCAEASTVEAFNQQLRILRRRLMVGLYWRDLNRLADFQEVSQAMTSMAEAFIQQALDFHYAQLSEKHGVPIGDESQQPQPLLVIGMGKLGGAELNVSSDIDLIFAFPETGKADKKVKSIENQKFFILLGQALIKSLNETTADGFVFRVDMRLRPYGQSGALASNFTELENYYQTQGRDWERFAGIKARVVATAKIPKCGDSPILENRAVDAFYGILLPFVYRKYIDFSTIESLRRLKIMIVQEVRRKGLADDVKLGAGGIREIEFIAQSFQLIRGGRDSRLQERHLLTVLDRLHTLNNLDKRVVDALSSAYVFLRTTEHAIQAMQDAQTQRLPTDQSSQDSLAWIMGFEGWDSFYQRLAEHRQFVSATFQDVIADPNEEPVAEDDLLSEWQSFWAHSELAELSFLEPQTFVDCDSVVESVNTFKESRKVLSLSANAREKLDVFMPRVLQLVSESHEPDETLLRVMSWLESIVTRTSYVLLLLENPQTLKHLVFLFSSSSWITETLTRMPSLLDELLYPETLYMLPEKAHLRDELRQRLLRIEPDDVEAHMEMLRYFSLAHSLNVAACEVEGNLPLMKVSDYLTFIAEAILEQVLQLAWHGLTRRHGYPAGATDESPRFLVVGYGKLGGIEMSYSSDLDLVFIYDADIQGMTDGNKPLDNQTFYTRLGQKIIHILNTRTLSGQLYEVDMRLRPSGNSGLLVSSLSAFSRYQLQDAWIWEHQALVRARPVAGDNALANRFIELRREILCLERDANELKKEVVVMREKMREHLGTSTQPAKTPQEKTEFHLKQDAGGIVDIEFMVQYAVLAWSHGQPSLSQWTDNIRLLERLQESAFVSSEHASQLIEIYQSYRSYGHRLVLQQKASSVIEGDSFVKERQQVKALWDSLLD